eukprot:13496345-Ditylum_brightwellii.AAC.1
MREGNYNWEDRASLKEKPVSHSSTANHEESGRDDRASLEEKPAPPTVEHEESGRDDRVSHIEKPAFPADVLLIQTLQKEADESRREDRASLNKSPVSHSSTVEHEESGKNDRASYIEKHVPPAVLLLSGRVETQYDESRSDISMVEDEKSRSEYGAAFNMKPVSSSEDNEIYWQDRASHAEKHVSNYSMMEDGVSRRKDRTSPNKKPVSLHAGLLLSGRFETQEDDSRREDREFLNKMPVSLIKESSGRVEMKVGESRTEDRASYNKKPVFSAGSLLSQID